MDLQIHLRQRLVHVQQLAAESNSFPCRSKVRTGQMSCPGRNVARSNPTERKNCNHWHSCQSVRRPGTFFM